MFGEDKNKIEDVKRHLYDPNDNTIGHQKESILHKVDHEVLLEWNNDNLKKENDMKNKFKKPPISIFKKFFIGSFVFFIFALGFAYYKFLNNDVSVSSDKINIEVVGNAFTKGGEDLPLQIEITNNNNASLEFSNLIVEYPKGADDNNSDIIRLPRDTIGTIKPGESVIRNIEVKLFGEEKSIRNIKISLEYHPEGSNAIFTKYKYHPVTISLAPISLLIEGPSSVSSNQPVSFKIKAILNTSLPSDNSILQVTYPNNFIFGGSTLPPSVGNSIWDLSSLSISNPITFEINGQIIGENGDEQVFHVYAGTRNDNNQSLINVVYSSVLQKVLITKPFLEARILVNGQDKKEYSVSDGSSVNVDISWVNNLSNRITDGQIIVNLSGNVFDENALNPLSGFYDSLNNQIIWDKNSVSSLAEINPGETGTVSFNFKPYSLIGLSKIKDPEVLISLSIKGREPLLGSNYNDINNFSEKVLKITSNFQIASSAFYLSGNKPPKAESETKYTVNWTLFNSTNNITGAEARSLLPIYVNWVGLSQQENEDISYNEVTREVVWKIGSVLPKTGIDLNREASFVISIRPSLSQVGSIPQLMKEIYLSGTDSFTNTLIKSVRGPITTSLNNDSIKQGEQRVIE